MVHLLLHRAEHHTPYNVYLRCHKYGAHTWAGDFWAMFWPYGTVLFTAVTGGIRWIQCHHFTMKTRIKRMIRILPVLYRHGQIRNTIKACVPSDFQVLHIYLIPHTPHAQVCFTGDCDTTYTSPQKVNFTAQYRQRPRATVNELEEFFSLPQEDFETCDPLQWWAGHCSQFPNLSRFARDILSIPGMF